MSVQFGCLFITITPSDRKQYHCPNTGLPEANHVEFQAISKSMRFDEARSRYEEFASEDYILQLKDQHYNEEGFLIATDNYSFIFAPDFYYSTIYLEKDGNDYLVYSKSHSFEEEEYKVREEWDYYLTKIMKTNLGYRISSIKYLKSLDTEKSAMFVANMIKEEGEK